MQAKYPTELKLVSLIIINIVSLQSITSERFFRSDVACLSENGLTHLSSSKVGSKNLMEDLSNVHFTESYKRFSFEKKKKAPQQDG